MIKSAREEHKTPLEIAEYYTNLFFNDLKELNIETPEIVCKATDHIPEMLEYVELLVKKDMPMKHQQQFILTYQN